MNIYIAFLCLSLTLVIPATLMMSEETEEEQGDGSDDLNESLHEGYRAHRTKTSKNFIIKGRNRQRREYFGGNLKRTCAIMYKNEKPIGILEPYQDSYRLLPVDAEDQIPVQIDPIMTKRQVSDHEEEEDYSKGFKSATINERYPYIFAKFKVDSRLDRVPQASRAKRNSNRKLIGEKNMHSLADALSQIENNDALAEEKLKGILSDIGLIEGDEAIVKRESKNENSNDKPQEPPPAENKTGLIQNDRSQSHEQNMNGESEEENDQTVGDREKREDISEEMKNRIQEKLSMLKEEVQDEIERLKADQDTESEEEGEGDGQDSTQRRKRNAIATLVDEETSDIDPLKNNEGGLVPHIRRRRQANNPDKTDPNSHQVRFQSRNLQHYEDDKELEKEDKEQKIIDGVTREKKNCECKEGEKNCVCTTHSNKPTHQQQSRFQDGKYSLDIDPDIYRIIDPSSDSMSSRKRRESFANLVAIHGGGPVVNHLLAVKERSMFNKHRYKRESKGNQLKLVNMLDRDLFGPLPQNYEGELIRYKRVKRD